MSLETSTLPADPGSEPASPATWPVVLLVLAGLAATAAAGWIGYRQGLAGAPAAGEAAAGAAAAPASAARAAVTASAPGSPPTARVNGPAGARSPAPATPGRPAPGERVAAAPGRAASAPDPLAWPLWEFQLRQPIPPRNPPLTPPPWRLVGATLASEGWRVVVLRQGNGTPEYFGVGQELPGGYRIQSINDEEVTLLINKREVTLSYTGSR